MGALEKIDITALKGLTQDSRKVRPGFLFAAFPGVKTDGREYIAAAIQNGASVILAPKGTSVDMPENVQLITDENPRKIFAHLAAAFYKNQPEYIAAVTGTNGKTSVVHFAAQIWSALGLKSASLGTLSGKMTTLETVELHEELTRLEKDGMTHLAMEASSHGLDQYRLDGVRIKAAGFTNLSRDHLDYHENMEDYLAAKVRLFSDVLEEGGTAVLNADVPEFKTLKTICDKRGIRVIDYGRQGTGIGLMSARPLPQGQEIEIRGKGLSAQITLPLVGRFQAMNVLCALGLVMAEHPDDPDWLELVLERLPALQSPPGRLQRIESHSQDVGIYIDYAHTPDALETVLTALRPHTEKRLICVFGCGGDRDKGKRPQMGEIAARLADIVIITDDNPRSEDPATIRAEILSAAPKAEEIPGRRNAIEKAVRMLGRGDVLIIAGKGHERGQIFADHTEDFDDAEEARAAINKLSLTTV
ncbi:MAG: UDP-N-acetylmuramoyl-L-alanyl-D-glutamate--2,6-diaminopimelate ligase [Alphaproteobacteria bacterium]|nr:UDP-N-acetylmuramoyl-L-alanyl-D-glutamate--2,6-diaminopimelate ligase [Alphaproteobacteria bacterium]